jgi:hypothetical protein
VFIAVDLEDSRLACGLSLLLSRFAAASRKTQRNFLSCFLGRAAVTLRLSVKPNGDSE